jgi:hypothetical protein
MPRKSDYTDIIADEICDRIANGESLRSICKDEFMPSVSAVMRWLGNPANHNFREQYARAREAQADAIFDEMLDISDNAINDWMEREGKGAVGYEENGEAIRRTQIRLDARKWVLGRMSPKKYGDKTTVESTSTVKVEHTRKLDISTLTDEQLDALEGALRETVAQLGGPVIEHEE